MLSLLMPKLQIAIVLQHRILQWEEMCSLLMIWSFFANNNKHNGEDGVVTIQGDVNAGKGSN